jgi:DNA-binding MarR family transcriptional regulator
MISNDIEIDLLEKIFNDPNRVRQRDLARIIGLSLGMTNAILKRLVQKGLLKIRKVNNRNIQYVVSPQGAEKIARRSYRYFRRTIKNVVYYKEAIEEMLVQIAARGFTEIVLMGSSDLDFIVEHLCTGHHLGFTRAGKTIPRTAEGQFLLYPENSRETQPSGQASASLRRVVLLSKPRRQPSAVS